MNLNHATAAPDLEYAIIRSLNAPRDRVFLAWTDPEQFARWFGPREFPPPSDVSMDVQPGGKWSVVLISPAGADVPLGGSYRQVSPPDRLVFTTGDPDNTTGDLASVVTVELTETNGRTEMTFVQAGYNTDEEHANAAKAGWLQFFDRLDEFLAA